MPAEEKRGVAAKGHRADEVRVCGAAEELDEWELVAELEQVRKVRNGRLTIWKRRVKTNVVLGVMSGKIAKEVSPTRPLVTLLIADCLTASPNRGATTLR